MTIVTVSPKFQVVIPSAVRKLFGIDPGEKLQVISYNDRIELLPIKKIKSMRGFIKGMDSVVERDKDRL